MILVQKILRFGIFVLVHVLFSPALLFAQKHILFDQISSNDGLSQNDVNTIYQDNENFVWFGTHEGLNKYDGYQFITYTPDLKNNNSINSNLIYAISGDKNGDLWIGTKGNGINFFNKKEETFTYFTHDVEDKKSLSNNNIHAILVDHNNHLWIGTDQGLNFLDINKDVNSPSFEKFYLDQEIITSKSNTNPVTAIFEDHKNTIWVGTNEGIYKRSRDQNGAFYFHQLII